MNENQSNNLCALRFKEALNDNSLKAVELSEMTGLPKATLSHYSTGRRVPSRNTANILGSKLGVNPAWLMGFNVPKYLTTPEDKLTQAYIERENKEKLYLYYAQLTPEQQDKILSLIKTMI